MSQELNELHEQLRDVTKYVITVCKENGLRCYLSWGSALGAVRHGNIIPWDDDIDLYLPYEDYKRFKEVAPYRAPYFYQDMHTDPLYFNGWAKIRKDGTTSMDCDLSFLKIHWGVCVDLFPLQEYDKPVMDNVTKCKVKMLHLLARLPYYQYVGTTLPRKILAAFYSIIGQKGREQLFEKLLNSVQRKGEYYLDTFSDSRECIISKKDLGEGKMMTFGDFKALVPSNYDHYLRSIYGDDYMEIPPESSEKRYVHSGSFFDCHRDYREYQKNH